MLHYFLLFLCEPASNEGYDPEIWREVPVSITKYSADYLREPFYPLQGKFCEQIVGPNTVAWDTTYDEGHAFWGKGGGKDRTIAKLLSYIAYKLLCMNSPQLGLSKILGRRIGRNSPIDLVNVSKDEKQAKNVFFKNFKSIIRMCVNPKTKRNWFEERGVDLREGQDIQNTEIQFPHSITAHSLNSKIYAGEGLTILFAVMDEVGCFALLNALAQKASLRTTIDSRFPRIGKLLLMSYMYNDNDAMHMSYTRGLKNDRILSSRLSTWQVNLGTKKADFREHYSTNIDSAKRTYECRGTDGKGGDYIKRKNTISIALNKDRPHPIKGNIVTTDNVRSLRFKDWFKGAEHLYSVHVDLSKGKMEEGGDAAGFALVHPELMPVTLDRETKRELKALGMAPMEGQKRKGIVIDLAIQITAGIRGEIIFSDIRELIYLLKDILKFNIVIVSFDGWQSVDSLQQIHKRGIRTEEVSVDKNNDAYGNCKDLFYQQLIRGYPNMIVEREFGELLINASGKVDHPKLSHVRAQNEGIERGSKDVSDAIAGAAYMASENLRVEVGIGFG